MSNLASHYRLWAQPFHLAWHLPLGPRCRRRCHTRPATRGCTGETWVVYVDDILILPTPGPMRSWTEAAEQSAEADDATEGATVPRRQ